MDKNQNQLKLYESLKSHNIPPRADAMIESFGAIGYNPQTAIADLIDNCISANATKIWLNFDWDAQNSTVSILDNGFGMDKDEIIQAMQLGSKNPNEIRNTNDLGRFGLGLKTASFSQCRKLTAVSKKNSKVCYCTWDLDYINEVNEWKLIELKPQQKFLDLLEKIEKGTLIIWENLDRIIHKNAQKDSEIQNNKDYFYEIAETVAKHLAMVFHRYLENKKINIFFNERELNAWDPFLKGFDGSQIIDNNIGKINIKGYILPHKSKLTEEQYKNAEGINGWCAQQGFYIYRNERLLVAGDWLGMFRKEDHYKLARIMIDLPNTIDDTWQLDIKKSVVVPPSALKAQIKAIAGVIRARAVEVFRHKGKVLLHKYPSNQFQPVWQEITRHGKRFYEINRENEVIKNLITLSNDKKTGTNQLLRFIEESIPIDLITIKNSENSGIQGFAFEGAEHNNIRELMKSMYQSLTANGKNSDQAKGYIMSIEPFNLYPQYVETLS